MTEGEVKNCTFFRQVKYEWSPGESQPSITHKVGFTLLNSFTNWNFEQKLLSLQTGLDWVVCIMPKQLENT